MSTETVRTKPYTSADRTFASLIEKPLYIACDNRNFQWTDKELLPVLEDCKTAFEGKKYHNSMGTLDIYINKQNQPHVKEGQHRITTNYLKMLSILHMYPAFGNTRYGLKLFSELKKGTDAQKKIWSKHGNDKNFKLPNLWLTNPYDNAALIAIANRNFIPYMSHFTCINEDEEKYKCNLCSTNLNWKRNLKKHLKGVHKDITSYEHTNDSLIYNACNTVTEFIHSLNYDADKMEEYMEFIMDYTEFDVKTTSDPIYSANRFILANNRGKKVECDDIVKNMILNEIKEENREEVNNQWSKITSSEKGAKLIDIATQLYKKSFIQGKMEPNDYQPLIEGDAYMNIQILFQIVEKLQDYLSQIHNDRFGRLFTLPGCNIAWEGYHYLLLPLFYTIEYVDTTLLKHIQAWNIRNMMFPESKTFNSFVYVNPFIGIMNEVLKNKDYPYFQEICKVLKNIDFPIVQEDVSFIQQIEHSGRSAKKSLGILYYLETLSSTNSYIPPFDLTLEHIYPQSKQDLLEDSSHVHKLGNLTLLEGPNTKENGHRGNKSLQDKPYSQKKESYEQSGCTMTRKIPHAFPGDEFTEADIHKRTRTMAKFLAKQTNIYT